MNAHLTWGDVLGVGDVPGYRRARWKPADSGTRPGSVMGAHGAALWKCADENAIFSQRKQGYSEQIDVLPGPWGGVVKLFEFRS